MHSTCPEEQIEEKLLFWNNSVNFFYFSDKERNITHLLSKRIWRVVKTACNVSIGNFWEKKFEYFYFTCYRNISTKKLFLPKIGKNISILGTEQSFGLWEKTFGWAVNITIDVSMGSFWVKDFWKSVLLFSFRHRIKNNSLLLEKNLAETPKLRSTCPWENFGEK